MNSGHQPELPTVRINIGYLTYIYLVTTFIINANKSNKIAFFTVDLILLYAI